MQDSIYHMALKSHLIRDFNFKTSKFCHKKARRFHRQQHIRLPSNLHILSTTGLPCLLHGFITLSDATSYDKLILTSGRNKCNTPKTRRLTVIALLTS